MNWLIKMVLALPLLFLSCNTLDGSNNKEATQVKESWGINSCEPNQQHNLYTLKRLKSYRDTLVDTVAMCYTLNVAENQLHYQLHNLTNHHTNWYEGSKEDELSFKLKLHPQEQFPAYTMESNEAEIILSGGYAYGLGKSGFGIIATNFDTSNKLNNKYFFNTMGGVPADGCGGLTYVYSSQGELLYREDFCGWNITTWLTIVPSNTASF